ncbi:MAG: CoA pyrophosphatase [Flavobacterium sp.]|uniref:NUDIX hydrolase n=1 Tax=Flavobacterium sp. TaxID=239 RepID=UPI0011F4A1D0|nr:CoA pyrophosphatase [Flavobacterium sp.]RZJ65167.1 MAG: CoA pyrophosphatase [Flavobacterium sp.]
MDFTEFLHLLPKIQNETLPGESAHAKMFPPERQQLMQNLDWDNLNARSAAVMLLLYPRNEKTNFVLILRNAYKGVHSSQVAFPGGKREAEDASYAETALRETFEEVGIRPDQISVVRELSRIYIPPSNFIVYPFLGYSEQELIFTPDPREVAGIIEVSVDDFLDDATVVGMTRDTSYATEINVPGFKIGEHVVWGATAMILSEFKEVVKTLAKR